MSVQCLSPFLSRGDWFPGVVSTIEMYADMGAELNESLPLEQRLVKTEYGANYLGTHRVFESYEAAVDWCRRMKDFTESQPNVRTA